jgi:hypothetical protein
MIVQPDFLDHWKTLRLASVLSDPLAPIYVIRLWGYVQTSRKDTIPDDAETLKAICRWPGAAGSFLAAMLDSRWIEKVDGGLRVHDWAEVNNYLVHNWTVGCLGGRPRVTNPKPANNPRDNPRDNPTGTHKIGLDKIGLDKSVGESTSAGAKDVNKVLTGANPAKSKTTRERNPLMDALSECDGGPEGLHGSAWSRIAKALSMIREASPVVTPDEIRARSKNYSTHFSCALTSTALASHWAKCKDAAPATPRNQPPELINTFHQKEFTRHDAF